MLKKNVEIFLTWNTQFDAPIDEINMIRVESSHFTFLFRHAYIICKKQACILSYYIWNNWGFLGGTSGKAPPANAGD